MSGASNSFFAELKRRNVYRVAIAYIIASWLFLQVLELIVSLAGAPDWIGKLFLGLLLLGLPIVLVLAWVYELTPEGIKREKDVERTTSITPQTASRLDKTIIGIFIIAVAWIVADRTILTGDAPPVVEEAAVVADEIVATEIIDKSIAVLPFMNMSEDAGAGHFSDGLADTVLHKLAQIESLRVVARNSSFQFRGKNVDVREVGEQLNVSNVLEGSVQAAGNKIRVTAQLIQAETGYHLWSGNFDRELNDVFAIQDEIAEEVVAALQVSLGDDDAARLARRDTDNVDAFRAYSLALREIDDFSFESLPRAIEHLDKAIALDPGYALAWATKALTYWHMLWIGSITQADYEEIGGTAIVEALRLQPDLPLALALTADLEHDARRFDTALPMIERAVNLAPNDATIHRIYASIMRAELQPYDSLDIIRKALELDPLSVPAHQGAAGLLDELGRHDEALELSQRMQVLNPSAPAGWWSASYARAGSGDWAQAVMSMIEAHQVDPYDPITAMDVAWNYLALGLDDIAAAWMDKAREIDPQHPAALTSLLAPALGDAEFDEDRVRVARKLMIENVPDDNGARRNAYAVLEREAYRTGYFGEFLAWVRHYSPELFEPTIDSVDEYPIGAMHVGRALLAIDQETQGRKLIDLGLARVQARLDAYKTPPAYEHFHAAALVGDRDRALEVLEILRDSTKLDTLIAHRFERHTPWIREYWHEPAYQSFEAAMERRAAAQRELLLELNGGEYPLPE